MVDFGNTAFEGTIQPEVPVVQPVVDQSGEGFAAGLANGISNVNDIFNASKVNNANKNTHINGSLAADITEQISLLADGVDQGARGFTRAEALTRLRAKTNEWMANNPGQESLIQEYINKSLGPSGLAPELSEDTPAEKAKKAVLEEAYKFGWSFDPNMSEDAAVNLYTKHKRDLQTVEDIGTQISLIEGQGKIVSAQLKSQATMALHAAINSGLPWVQGKIDEGFKKLDGVTDPAARAAIISDVETQITSQISIVDDLRTKSENSIDTSYMTEGFKSLLQNFKDVANGKETLDQYKSVSDLQQAKLGAMINMDPELAAALTFDKMSGFSSQATLPLITAGMTRILKKLTDSGNPDQSNPSGVPPQTADIVGQSSDISSALAATADQLKQMNADPSKVDPETAKEANAKIIGMFKSVARHAGPGMDPRELNDFMKFMADPNTGAWIETHMKDLAPQVSTDARQIVEQYYQKVGVELINERWGAASVTMQKTSPIGPGGGGLITDSTVDLFKSRRPGLNGSGIEFQVAPEFQNDAYINNQAKKLTTDVAGPLNNMVRAQAHMQGTRDYKKVYDEQFAKRLWVAGPDVPGDITDLNASGSAIAGKNGLSGYLTAIAAQESGGSNTAKTPNSSATGKYQFTTGTWAQVSKTHPELGLTPDGRTDEAQQEKAVKALTQDNADLLKAAGQPVNYRNLYMVHFLGWRDAEDILTANDNEPVTNLLSPKVISANPFLKDMTVADLKKWALGVVK